MRVCGIDRSEGGRVGAVASKAQIHSFPNFAGQARVWRTDVTLLTDNSQSLNLFSHGSTTNSARLMYVSGGLFCARLSGLAGSFARTAGPSQEPQRLRFPKENPHNNVFQPSQEEDSHDLANAQSVAVAGSRPNIGHLWLTDLHEQPGKLPSN